MKVVARIIWALMNVISAVCGIIIAALFGFGLINLMRPVTDNEAFGLVIILVVPMVMIAAIIYAAILSVITYFIMDKK